MKKIVLLFMFMFLMPLGVFADEIYKIDMKVDILKDGTANITEVWDVEATDTDTTEWYKQMYELAPVNAEVSNFKVLMDGKELKEKEEWDINAGLTEKAGYYGIYRTTSGVELCFGITDFERHTFTLSYTVSNYIFNTSDSQVLYWSLVPNVDGGIDEFNVTVSSYYDFPDTLDVWGYGYDGYVYVEDGVIKMNDPYYGLDDDEYVVLLTKFPENTFDTKNTHEEYVTFDDVYDVASYGVIDDDDYDYDYSYDYDLDDEDIAGIAGMASIMIIFIIVMVLISMAIGVYSIIVMWKVFDKANKPGWAAIVPFYNMYVLFEITWGNGWLFLTMFASIIPFFGAIAVMVITIITYVKLAKSFGKEGGFAVGLIFLNIIFMSILAFSKNCKYVGVPEKSNNNSNMNYNNYGMNNYSTPNDVMYCSNCGTKLENDSVFCPNCGTRK